MSTNETKFCILFEVPLFYVCINMGSSGGKGNYYKIRVELRKKERKKEKDYLRDLGVDGRLLSD